LNCEYRFEIEIGIGIGNRLFCYTAGNTTQVSLIHLICEWGPLSERDYARIRSVFYVHYVFALSVVYLQNGGECDQNPFSVHMMLDSPTRVWPSLQLNVTRAPTVKRRWLRLVPPMRPLSGAIGITHWMTTVEKNERERRRKK